MGIDVATVSVISSSAVAILSIGSTIWAARQQRSHDKNMAHDERVWEARSKALLTIIGTAVAARDELRKLLSPGAESHTHTEHQAGQQESVIALVSLLDSISSERGAIEAYTGADCRNAVDRTHTTISALHDRLGYGNSPSRLPWLRKHKEKYIDLQDFEGAADLRRQEKQILDTISSTMTMSELQAVKADVEGLIDAARREMNP